MFFPKKNVKVIKKDKDIKDTSPEINDEKIEEKTGWWS